MMVFSASCKVIPSLELPGVPTLEILQHSRGRLCHIFFHEFLVHATIPQGWLGLTQIIFHKDRILAKALFRGDTCQLLAIANNSGIGRGNWVILPESQNVNSQKMKPP